MCWWYCRHMSRLGTYLCILLQHCPNSLHHRKGRWLHQHTICKGLCKVRTASMFLLWNRSRDKPVGIGIRRKSIFVGFTRCKWGISQPKYKFSKEIGRAHSICHWLTGWRDSIWKGKKWDKTCLKPCDNKSCSCLRTCKQKRTEVPGTFHRDHHWGSGSNLMDIF